MGARQFGAASTNPIEMLARAVTALAARVGRLEAAMSGQTAPADTRFERELDPVTGELSVYVVRVSTGNREKIAGPL